MKMLLHLKKVKSGNYTCLTFKGVIKITCFDFVRFNFISPGTAPVFNFLEGFCKLF